jgi:N4-(beta-N-acetylglucosaminyl)-L-asparaginase
MKRRDFVKAGATVGAAAAMGASPASAAGTSATSASAPSPAFPSPAVHRAPRARPLVISDTSGIRFRNGGTESAVERAYRGITQGEDPLDALIAGVNIPELDPEETGIGYGGMPNADGVVQLDSCCMHGPRRWAGGVAAIEGVRTPSKVAKAVMELTDHHLLVGKGAQDFARQIGFEIEDDLNTERSRAAWLEWRRRIDPEHFLNPQTRLRSQQPGTPGDEQASRSPGAMRAAADAWHRAGLEMVKEGLIPEHSYWGTINCDAVTANGDICGVTTTSGLAWKIPGRVGDSPILGAGLYVDNEVGAAGSTGRGEANLYNLTSFLVVELMRGGMRPKDAGLEALRRVVANNVEGRLRNARGLPNFNLRLYVLNKDGEYAGCALYAAGESTYAVCDANGPREEPLEPLLQGAPTDE